MLTSNPNPLVSIVIPCYNDAKYIKDAVASAQNQNYQNKEIIVVDDGSDIRTKEVLEKLEMYIDKIIFQENKGVSFARNVGINAASGEYIIVLDSDDSFEPNFCSKGINVLLQIPNVKIVTCYTRRLLGKKEIDIIRPQTGCIKDLIKYNCAMGSSMFRKKDWEICGKYDEEMKRGFEDWEFYIRLLKEGGESFVIPEILFNYRLRRNSKTTQANKIKYHLCRYIYSKHRELYIEHFDDFIDHLLNRLEIIEESENKILKKTEYRIGNALLLPLRKIRIFLKRI